MGTSRSLCAGHHPSMFLTSEFQHRPESRVLFISQSLNIHTPSRHQDRRWLSSSPYEQVVSLLFSQNPVPGDSYRGEWGGRVALQFA